MEKEAELAQMSAEIALLRSELEAQVSLAGEQDLSAPSSSNASEDPIATSHGSTRGKDAERELKSLRKEHRKLTAQISAQWKTIATLRAIVSDADARYGTLYPIEKAIVILSAIYGEKLRGQPTVRSANLHPRL